MQYTPEMNGLTLYYAVRAAFPCPDEGAHQQDHCVGGALYKFMHSYDGQAYPKREFLAGILTRANPALGRSLSAEYASRIIHLNDTGKYEEAWLAMKAALTHDNQASKHTVSSTAGKVTA